MLLCIRTQRTDIAIFFKVNIIEVYLQIVTFTLFKCVADKYLTSLK